MYQVPYMRFNLCTACASHISRRYTSYMSGLEQQYVDLLFPLQNPATCVAQLGPSLCKSTPKCQPSDMISSRIVAMYTCIPAESPTNIPPRPRMDQLRGSAFSLKLFDKSVGSSLDYRPTPGGSVIQESSGFAPCRFCLRHCSMPHRMYGGLYTKGGRGRRVASALPLRPAASMSWGLECSSQLHKPHSEALARCSRLRSCCRKKIRDLDLPRLASVIQSVTLSGVQA